MAKERLRIPAKSSPSAVPWLAIGIIILVVAGLAIMFRPGRQQQTTKTGQTASVAPVAVTPLHFTDFIGTVETVDDQGLTVLVMITESDGQRRQRRYRVGVDAQTTWQLVTITNTGTAVAPLSIGGMKKNDTVQVYGPGQNLYDLKAVTASRLVKLISL